MKTLELKKLKAEAVTGVINIEPTVNKDNVKKAIEFLSKKGLKHNFTNGKTYLGKEVISSPIETNKIVKFEQYDSLEEAVQWELCYEVLNYTHMLDRGVVLK